MAGNERSVVRPHDPDVGREQMDFQSNGSNNGSNGDHETFGLTEATPVFNGTSNVKRVVADPGRENVLVLPAGVSLDDIDVQGDNLVIKLPDGTEMIVINGAIYVPEIVIDGVTVPPMNLAALLNAEAPEPAAGETRSSGGNFADPVDPIQPAYDIGDLLPYTELFFPQPEDQEIIPGLVNRVPEITFIPETGDGTVVDEDGLPVRDGETPGTRDQTDGETTTGTILYVSPDGTERLLIDGQDIFELNDQGEVVILEPFVTGYPLGNGVLVINEVDIATGSITYTYTLNDNTTGDDTFVEFEITVIDPQGDSDTGTARIDIIDDAPFTNNDGLLATLDDSAEGVVVGTVAQLLSNDEYGADGAGTPAIVIATGSLGGTISIVNGELVYTSNYNVAPGQSVTETFTYTIRDGDGDVSNTSTFTIILTDDGPTIGSGPDDIAAIIAVDEEGLDDGIAGGPENDLPGEATVINGTFAGFSYGGDGPGNVVLAGATYNDILTHAGNPVVTTWNSATHTLTGEDSVTGEDVFTIVLAVDENGKPTGEYTFTLLQPLTHADGDGENDLDLQVVATITDSEGDANTGVINITIDDDSPTISVDPRYEAGDVILDESPAGQDEDTDQTPADADAPAGRDSVDFDFTDAFEDGANFGADGPGSITYALNLSANGVQSGLFALDVTDAATNDDDGYGQGEPILLYQVDATTVIGYVGESPADGENYTTYFTITIDPDTGVGTFTQTGNVWHADTTNDDDTSFLDIVDGDLFVEATAIDFDNDPSAPAQLSIGHDVLQIQDDGPSLAISVIAESGEVNDDALVATTSDADLPDSDNTLSLTSFFSVTTASYGTDGEGTLSETYGLTILDSDTSLTSGGDPITLSYGPAVDGKVSVVGMADGDVVFTITVDTATGALTLEQSGPIDHAEGTDSTLLGAGVLEATYDATITDADGDTESLDGSIDLGDNISFGDDVPTIVVDPDYEPDAVILDESPAGQDEDTDQTPADADAPAGRDSVDFDFTAAFTDGTDYGNDVPGDTQYSLLLTSQNLASGLFALDVTDAATNDDDGYGQGEPILLYQVDATTVIGYVGESPADG
ncbi:DUF5801 repeats-in-toxin domain-containing protein, partial [Croceicoccus sp. BE223]|uniref:DUF5801 repeats-in-toxin domain-containing protein n=1 Tax=Croceicoccus sp. BE223 TaxID=2817716 RepID=UPI002863A10F